MAEIIFLLCALLSALCAFMLHRKYRRTGNLLLLWSALAFLVLTISNIHLCVDNIIYPHIDNHGPFWRGLLTAIAGSLLLYGLIMEIS